MMGVDGQLICNQGLVDLNQPLIEVQSRPLDEGLD